MTDDEREAYRRTLMSQYEKALLEYGIAYGICLKHKQEVFARAYYDYLDIPFQSMRESYVINRFNDKNYIESIQNAWRARCKALKLKKELSLYSGQ